MDRLYGLEAGIIEVLDPRARWDAHLRLPSKTQTTVRDNTEPITGTARPKASNEVITIKINTKRIQHSFCCNL